MLTHYLYAMDLLNYFMTTEKGERLIESISVNHRIWGIKMIECEHCDIDIIKHTLKQLKLCVEMLSYDVSQLRYDKEYSD